MRETEYLPEAVVAQACYALRVWTTKEFQVDAYIVWAQDIHQDAVANYYEILASFRR